MSKSYSQFTQSVICVIQAVPYGKVASYGQIAAYVGVPRAARQVGWILRQVESSEQLPWWRVINNAGRISIQGNLHNDKILQKKLLEQEGITVTEDFTLDIEKYRFKANMEQLKTWGLSEAYRAVVLEKYGL